MLPTDEPTRELYLELARQGIDPDEAFESMRDTCRYGGLHKWTTHETLDRATNNIEQWEPFEAVIAPTQLQHDHHYELIFQTVEWKTEGGWKGPLSSDISAEFQTFFGTDTYFDTEVDSIGVNSVESYVDELGCTPTGLRLENIKHNALVPSVNRLSGRASPDIVIHDELPLPTRLP